MTFANAPVTARVRFASPEDGEREVKGYVGTGCARSGRMAGIDGERGSKGLGLEVLGTHRGSESQKCMFYKGLRCE